jgi:GNAT acetyltransferase-like protein
MRWDSDDPDLLRLEVEALYVLTGSGRLVCRNTPDHEAAARLRLAGCRSGNHVRLRHDVGAATAQAIERLAADEPPLYAPGSRPIHLDAYLELLAVEAPVEQWDLGLVWSFPDQLDYRHSAPLVASDTPEGDRLLARLRERGMPAALVDAGFVDVGRLWAPWCVALDGDEIASLAFTVGLSPASAEVGVYTAERYRGRGLAAAVTAGWAALPALGGRVRFYSTTVANRSSQDVARRLGLRYVGAELTIR